MHCWLHGKTMIPAPQSAFELMHELRFNKMNLSAGQASHWLVRVFPKVPKSQSEAATQDLWVTLAKGFDWSILLQL